MSFSVSRNLLINQSPVLQICKDEGENHFKSVAKLVFCIPKQFNKPNDVLFERGLCQEMGGIHEVLREEKFAEIFGTITDRNGKAECQM